ncbi:MAG: lamin tail domain-containing protein, partial [Anaerolineales bacterium]|nr:lamin tail domain-containing protein [Anaerolineales bacterium]
MLTRRILVLVLLLLFASSTLSLVFAQSSAAPNDVTNLRINEFMALNQNNLEDPDEPGTHPDWIEIYNGGGTAVNLQNLYLSDDPTNLTKSPITATIMVPANDFVLFYADSQPEQGPHHTNFGLSGNGENILLVGNDGSTIIDSYTFGPHTADIAEARFPDRAD